MDHAKSRFVPYHYPVKRKRLLPPAYLFASLVIMALLHLFAPVATYIAFPYNLIGGIPLVLGIILNLVADAAFKRNRTTVKPFEESMTLVTDGVFRVSRHPMYLGMVLVLLGIAIVMGSLTPLIVVVAFAIAMELAFVGTEEKMLEDKFGEAWRRYTRQVRRWI